MVIEFDKLFKTMIFAMRINRSHPEIPRDVKWTLHFFIMHGLFSLVFCLLIYSIVFHDLKNDDFAQACANGILCVIFSVVTFKYCVMLKYQNLLREMMETMKEDYNSAAELPPDEFNLIIVYAHKGQGVMKLWLWLSLCTASLFPLKTIAFMIYYATKSNFKYVHLYDLTYPSPVEEVKNNLGPYLGLYIMFSFYDIYAMFMYIAFPPLGPILMLHVCGQLELVRKRVLEIFSDKNYDFDKSAKALRNIVIHLQKIYCFVDKIKESFKVLYELTLKATIVIIPITLYQIIESFHNGHIKLEFIAIIFGALALSSIPCYYSDLMMEKGENVRLALYSCGWEKHWDRRTRSVILLLLVRTARLVVVRTMFCNVCLDALADVYHHSYALFNLLNAAWT